ncbi:guanine nucleotide-releasing factor 2-like isoform X3 [Anopheles albimanus]|uniref:guanine nucleotide-releasing factor 2-like isoform X3 n=1 Tax=Anopheles albimanus TaxID=7167 RepID=UPI00163FF823|nr:guanine nucleotide-releasing factor 2-like isoform X3 [Anopheles albimanus]
MSNSKVERGGNSSDAGIEMDNSVAVSVEITSTSASIGRHVHTNSLGNGSNSANTGSNINCSRGMGNNSDSHAPPGTLGPKGSIRANKLARRARSFKDDFLEKISQIRTPTSTTARSHSPNSPRIGLGSNRKSTTDEPAKPIQDLNYHVRQVKNALTHFKDVILKNKLEMLPGNGTVVLETIANVHTALQSYTLNENSTAFINATNHVYISLGNLLRLCDEVLLTKEGEDCPSLSKENVKEVIELVENAVNNLVNLANEKLNDRDGNKQHILSSNTLQRPTVDVGSQRTSLPDIPLTPRERDLLEQTCLKTVRASHSTENILRESSEPPPKPPLPDRSTEPPPLPPKRKSQHSKNFSFHDTSECNSDSTFLGCGTLDRMSLRSRSPEDNSSLLSASAGSLDSALNNSRDEEELRILPEVNEISSISQRYSSSINAGIISSPTSTAVWNESHDAIAHGIITNELSVQNNRNSNESGIESMYSLRVSRDNNNVGVISISPQKNAVGYVHRSESLVDSVNDVRCTAICAGTKLNSSAMHAASQQQIHQNLHQIHVLHHQHNQQLYQHQKKIETIVTQDNAECVKKNIIPSSEKYQLSKTAEFQVTSGNSMPKLIGHTNLGDNLGSDDVFPCRMSSERPPALPVKTRLVSNNKERHPSQYDNVDDVDTERSPHIMLEHISKQSSPSLMHSRQQIMDNLSNKHVSLFEPRLINRFQEEPPPLPIKKKHMFQSVAYSVMAYMEIFGSASQNQSEFMRHSVHTYNLTQSENASTVSHSLCHSHTMSLSPSCTAPVSPPDSPNINSKPPALPPKRLRINSKTQSTASTPPASPKIIQDLLYQSQTVSKKISLPSSKISKTTCSNTLDVTGTFLVKSKLSPNYRETTNEPDTCQISTSEIDCTSSYTTTTTTTITNSTSTSPVTTAACVYASNIPSLTPELNEGVCSCGTNVLSQSDNISTESSKMNRNGKLIDCNIDNQNPNSSDYLHLCNANTKASDNIYPSVSNSETIAIGNTLVTKINKSNNIIVNNNIGSTCATSIHNNSCCNSITSCKLVNSSDLILEPTTHDHCSSKALEEEVEVILRRNNKNGQSLVENQHPVNLMEELDVSNYLVFKKDNEDGPDVKGGHPDALIIHATRVQKNCDAYGEAFITTFRTFISPLELIQKLSHRYTVYHCQLNDSKQKAAKESFSLLVRVVNDLTAPDLTERLLVILMNFKYQLVSAGHLHMAKLLRVKLIEKVLIFKQKATLSIQTLSARAVMTSLPSLLDLKSAEIAEQMTLLDAELFQKIEIPEVLIWAQEQCEERSPNLTRFTEHFNKMSYWARTQILSQNDSKDREKHVIKFIKIMKHLRKINNYNSYLALLSALDSAPIRRLEWHKTITEGLKEYCALIDSSSSFRAYRQALAETNPPCIPYIGLVLQDLTFVHIGNPDLLPEGSTNFSKRWQQYHIVVNMKRFKKGCYPFKKNERIIGFFENFENYLDEDAMWQISENIKPRGTRKNNVN